MTWQARLHRLSDRLLDAAVTAERKGSNLALATASRPFGGNRRFQPRRPGIEVDFSLPSERVIRSLDRIIEWRGKPGVIRCDNGPEYISAVTLAWAAKDESTRIDFIQPGQPQQNAYVERYNRTVRYD